jgi:hypothetical protein
MLKIEAVYCDYEQDSFLAILFNAEDRGSLL